MGARGEKIRTKIRRLIDNPNIRTSMTFTARTQTSGSQGGYGPASYDPDSPTTIYTIPTQYVKRLINDESFGKLATGELRLIIRDDQDVSTVDTITFENVQYELVQSDPVAFNDVVVFNVVTVRRIV